VLSLPQVLCECCKISIYDADSSSLMPLICLNQS
jgi:hypothetical protein